MFNDQCYVLVIGDVMLDRYLCGSVARISPEAPVPVVRLQNEYCRLGGAANVAATLAAFGARVTLYGATGSDRDAAEFARHLVEYAEISSEVVADPRTRTICKTRAVTNRHQHMLRLDQDGDPAQFAQLATDIVPRVLAAIKHHQAVIIADYDKGLITEALAQAVIGESLRLGIPCIVDPKKRDFRCYRGATVITPNILEAERALGRTLSSNEEFLAAGEFFRKEFAINHAVLTRGADGMTLSSEGRAYHVPAETHEVADVSGAGDTVVATLAAAMSLKWEMLDACRLASMAAGIAVSHPGTYVVGGKELENAWLGKSKKIADWETARGIIQKRQEAGLKVVFTNGCFDILHAGHLSSLERARRLGDMLVIGLNSDCSVKLNKGESRPIISEHQRAELLAGLACVDLVVLFDELTPENLVRKLIPDIMVKGGDYRVEEIAGAEFVQSRGGKVVIIPLVPGLSTTRIIESGVALKEVAAYPIVETAPSISRRPK